MSNEFKFRLNQLNEFRCGNSCNVETSKIYLNMQQRYGKIHIYRVLNQNPALLPSKRLHRAVCSLEN